MQQSYFDYDSRAIINLDYWWGLGIVVTRINTPQQFRRQGIMRGLMFAMLKDADKEQVRLNLWINEYGDMSRDQLADWYQRCGFIETVYPQTNEPGFFTRPPVKRGTQPCPVCGQLAHYNGSAQTADYSTSGVPASRSDSYMPCGCLLIRKRGSGKPLIHEEAMAYYLRMQRDSVRISDVNAMIQGAKETDAGSRGQSSSESAGNSESDS